MAGCDLGRDRLVLDSTRRKVLACTQIDSSGPLPFPQDQLQSAESQPERTNRGGIPVDHVLGTFQNRLLRDAARRPISTWCASSARTGNACLRVRIGARGAAAVGVTSKSRPWVSRRPPNAAWKCPTSLVTSQGWGSPRYMDARTRRRARRSWHGPGHWGPSSGCWACTNCWLRQDSAVTLPSIAATPNDKPTGSSALGCWRQGPGGAASPVTRRDSAQCILRSGVGVERLSVTSVFHRLRPTKMRRSCPHNLGERPTAYSRPWIGARPEGRPCSPQLPFLHGTYDAPDPCLKWEIRARIAPARVPVPAAPGSGALDAADQHLPPRLWTPTWCLQDEDNVPALARRARRKRPTACSKPTPNLYAVSLGGPRWPPFLPPPRGAGFPAAFRFHADPGHPCGWKCPPISRPARKEPRDLALSPASRQAGRLPACADHERATFDLAWRRQEHGSPSPGIKNTE